jgi:2-oxoglutarate ferredoxin oxidoreductase subunit alpha
VPVIVLAVAYVANGAEPWRICDLNDVEPIDLKLATAPNAESAKGEPRHWPYLRDPDTLVRPWALPGTPGLEHRLGGLEKSASGEISYAPGNHEDMVRIRQQKIDRLADVIAPIEVDDPDDSSVLVLGWGSTFGAITAAVDEVRASGHSIARAHLRHLNPMPANLGEVLSRYDQVVVPEMNAGQLGWLLQARYLTRVTPLTQVRGTPLSTKKLTKALTAIVDNTATEEA